MMASAPAVPSSQVPAPFGDLLAQQAGARFLKADLQVHTPLDPAFPEAEVSDAAARMLLAKRYLEAAQGRGIELVGITEHNDVSWIEELRAAANQSGMHLLPGFEVETKEGIHVLCLFEPEHHAHVPGRRLRLPDAEPDRIDARGPRGGAGRARV